jgi:MFS family permease
MFNSARLVGPAVAGILIGAFGEGICFLVNGISYIAVIIALLAMKITYEPLLAKGRNIFAELKEGFNYTFGFPPIRYLIIFLALLNLVGMPYATLMPIVATKILHGNARTLGFLMSAGGVGALTGAAVLASRRTVLGLTRWISLSAFAFGIGIIAFSFSKIVWLSLPLLSIIGFAMIIQMASCNTILQTIVKDEIRGRVMSFYTMAFLGMAPFGSLMGGALADKIGTPHTVLICGIISIIGALAFTTVLPSLRQHVRPIYLEKGIIPEVAAGVEAVSEINVPPE